MAKTQQVIEIGKSLLEICFEMARSTRFVRSKRIGSLRAYFSKQLGSLRNQFEAQFLLGELNCFIRFTVQFSREKNNELLLLLLLL